MDYTSDAGKTVNPPSRSKNLLTDIFYFLLNTPKIRTLVKYKTREERQEYNHRIAQRIGVEVNRFTILNIHRIGVEAPVNYVFNELLNWNGDSTCWPNYIAHVERIDDSIEKINILPFGWRKYPFGMKSLFGLKFIPLFDLNSIRIESVPDTFNSDNARYLLYRCSGGYPIGIFAMYVRSPIENLGEMEHAQLFFVVGFNFYGNEKIGKYGVVNRIWEMVHNRVTENVLNRIKQLSEWRLQRIEQNKYQN